MNNKIEILELRIVFDRIEDENFIRTKISKQINKSIDSFFYRIIKRSIDARQKTPYFQLRVEVSSIDFGKQNYQGLIDKIPQVNAGKKVVIIGAGPAGYFAALECLRLGLKPIVLDRGKDVQTRRRDLKAIQQDHIVNPDSNYCFGEGGAGTYSDGKLYTRSLKRGKIQDVLELLVAHGAQEDILIEAHPHIGSNKLPKIVSEIRATIEEKGGEVLFDCCVKDFVLKGDEFHGVIDQNGDLHAGMAYILATGHSARDIYTLLRRHKIKIEAKPFALGVRIEHPQDQIDEIQYKQNPRSKFLPAAPYKLVSQVAEKGVFSFCMCPGGLIVPAATAPGEIVVNGMSLSKRDSPFANSGVVTEISLAELEKHGYKGVFAALNFQREIEQAVFKAGDGSQKAPAQRLTNFIDQQRSNSLPESSYIPGLHSANLHEILPGWVYKRLRTGIKSFEKKMKGYITANANVVAVESRTSSPIKIPRAIDTLMHVEMKNLFPCGEGAGYAGGILSAAMDGQNVAKAIAKYLN